MNDETVLIRALEPEDLEYLYKWENDMDLWDVSDTLTPFSHFTLKKYIDNADKDIYETNPPSGSCWTIVLRTWDFTRCTAVFRAATSPA